MTDEENTKQLRVVLKGETSYKFTELKGRLKAENNDEAVNKIIDKLHYLLRNKEESDKNRFSMNK